MERIFAVPTADRKLTAHFGHCQSFAVIKVENEFQYEYLQLYRKKNVIIQLQLIPCSAYFIRLFGSFLLYPKIHSRKWGNHSQGRVKIPELAKEEAND